MSSQEPQKTALVIEDGWTRSALAAVRALSAAGWTVGSGSPNGSGLASSSRATAHRHVVPAPNEDAEGFVEALQAAISERGYSVVFAAGDAEVLALSALRDRIPAVVPYADHDRVTAAVDKAGLAEAAAAVGVATPRTVTATDAELRDWQPPYLIKSSIHAPLESGPGPARLDVSIVDDLETAKQRAEEIRAAGSVPLLQEVVGGRLIAHSSVVGHDGVAIGGMLQVKDSVFPAGAGVAARAEVVADIPEVVDGVERLLAHLGWFGLAEVELFVEEGREPVVLDVNGRFYGCMELATAAGCNLPAVWGALALGLEPPAVAKPEPGLRFHWLEGDVRRALQERRGGLARDVAGSIRYSRGAVHTIWSPGDPMPAARQLAHLPARFARLVRG